jgi:hypothetical protein
MEELLAAAGIDKSHATVSVTRTNGKSRYDSAAEADEALPDADLTNLDSISLNGGQRADLTVDVYFFKAGTTLRVEGWGDHHIQVVGIADDLAAEIDRQGRRSLTHETRIVSGSFIAMLLLVGGSYFANQADAETLASILSIVALLPMAILLWLTMVRPVFMPAREIVPEGKQSRGSRWGHATLRVGGWALTLFLGAILGVLFQRWFGY